MKLRLSESFELPFFCRSRFLIMVGGAGSGKSYTAAQKIVFRCIAEPGHRVLVIRKVNRTLKTSCIQLVIDVLNENKITFDHNKTEQFIKIGSSEILFSGLDDPEKIKSIQGITIIWIEETTELSEADWDQLNLRLRGETKYYKQIMATFNPVESAAPWLKKRYFENVAPDVVIHRSTVFDNPFIDQEYIKQLQGIEDDDYRQIYLLGEWGSIKGLIYPKWDVFTDADVSGRRESADIFYGLDFGFNNPSALVEVWHIDDEPYTFERIYESKLTTADLGQRMIDIGVSMSAPIYADCAEPDRIEELRRMGFNVIPAKKDVEAGILFCKKYPFHIHEQAENMKREVKSYKWAEKNGISLEVPVKMHDHLVDSRRYAIFTHLATGPTSFATQLENDWRP